MLRPAAANRTIRGPLQIALQCRRRTTTRLQNLAIFPRKVNFSCLGYHPDLESLEGWQAAWVFLNTHPLVRMIPRDGGNILRLDCGLAEQLIEFARRELTPPAIRNANSVSGCFELAGFGDRDHRIDSVRLAASTVF